MYDLGAHWILIGTCGHTEPHFSGRRLQLRVFSDHNAHLGLQFYSEVTTQKRESLTRKQKSGMTNDVTEPAVTGRGLPPRFILLLK